MHNARVLEKSFPKLSIGRYHVRQRALNPNDDCLPGVHHHDVARVVQHEQGYLLCLFQCKLRVLMTFFLAVYPQVARPLFRGELVPSRVDQSKTSQHRRADFDEGASIQK